MATFAFNTMALAQGSTFVFGSWVCVGNGSGDFDSHLNNPVEPEAISSKSYKFIARSNNLGDMLLPDLAKEIELKLDINSSSTQTQIDLNPSSTQIRTPCAQPTFGLSNSPSAYQRIIKFIYSSYGASLDHTTYVKNSHATASREAPIKKFSSLHPIPIVSGCEAGGGGAKPSSLAQLASSSLPAGSDLSRGAAAAAGSGTRSGDGGQIRRQ